MPRARELMIADVVTVEPDGSVEEAISLMLQHGLSGLPVVDASDRLLGYLSEFDLIELFRDPKTSQDRVYHYMTRKLHLVPEDAELDTVAEQFRICSIRQLLVTRDDRLLGAIRRSDLLRYILRVRRQITAVTPPLPLPADVPVQNPAEF